MWTAPIIISAISAVLAFAIAIIDGIVNNYADVTISINEGQKTLSVKGGSPLLSSLATKGVFVPSACGGKGSCGACKVKVLSDIGPHLPTELPFMSPEEIKDNITLSNLEAISSTGIINEPKELTVTREYRDKLNIKCSSILQLALNLSGGNQQKVVLSKWLFANPDILILDEPTRGIDVGAKYEIYTIINRLASEGKGIIMISSELPEILGVCDRIYVMRDGKIVGEMPAKEASQERVMKHIMFDQEAIEQ